MTKQIPPEYKQTKVGIIPDSWGRFELNEILSISSEKFNPITNIENRRCIELEHLSQETGKNLGFINSNEQQSVKNVFVEGQVLFGKLRPYLKKFWKATFDGVCSSEIWVINGKKVSNNYLYFLVQTNKFIQVANVSSGSKMPRADWSYMSEVPFIVPLFQKEQEKIAEILSTWDEAISKQEELIKQKQIFKKSMMQQIFSQKIRFKDDNGNDYPAWQSKKLGDIGKISMCKRILKDETLPIGEVPFFKIGTFGGKADAYITRELYEKYIAQYPFPKAGDILISASGTIGRTVIYNGKPSYFQDSNIVWISNNEKLIQNRFLYFHYKMIKWNTEDTTIARLYNDNLRDISINTPCHDEQDKIANFLTSLDDEITKQTEILDQLKLQKQALMQKLLTGRVRVKYEIQSIF